MILNEQLEVRRLGAMRREEIVVELLEGFQAAVTRCTREIVDAGRKAGGGAAWTREHLQMLQI
ncbi:hypothetical protein [Thermomonas sp.]|uniref:hypothetical protein n=1 Tax=Thermomonas sp. TaxID=1971895 RepID=UPI00260E5357|nr:hypothetical protein [Thermomonas sp.]